MPSGRLRSMAGADGRMDGGGGRGGAADVAAVSGADIREPLRSLYQNSPNDPGLQDHYAKSLSLPIKSLQPYQHRPFVFGSSRSCASSRSASPDAEDAAHQSRGGVAGPDAGSEQRLRMPLSNLRSSHAAASAEEYHRAPSECSEIQNVDDAQNSPISMSEGSQSYGFSDSQLITDVEDNENLMQLKLEAMTWAAMAKDFTISSLEKRLRKALQIAKAEQAKNRELQSALDQSRHELSRARGDIAKLEEAEERLAREHGESEVDASIFAAERAKIEAEQARQHRAQLLMLEQRIKSMLGDRAAKGQHDRYSERSMTQESYAGGRWQESDAELLGQELERAQDRERALTSKLSGAEEEIEELKGELNDATNDLRVSEVLRKTQSRRLKVLEKERRYLLRKGALRTVKLAPRTQQLRRVEPSMPGGSGWNVFSVLEYAEA